METHHDVNVFREVALVVAGACLVFGCLYAFRSSPPPKPPERTVAIGDRLPAPFRHLPGRLFLLVLDARDAYSTADIATFNRLLVACKLSGINYGIVVPEASQVSHIAAQVGVDPPNVHVAPLRRLSLKGSPTAILLDSAGSVQGLWEGVVPFLEAVIASRLSSKTHTLATMVAHTDPHSSEPWVVFAPTEALFHETSEVELSTILQTHTLLDIGTRQQFAQSHKPVAVNIPLDELIVRASIELDHARPIVVDCLNTTRCPAAYALLQEVGFSSPLLLDFGAMGLSCRLHALRPS